MSVAYIIVNVNQIVLHFNASMVLINLSIHGFFNWSAAILDFPVLGYLKTVQRRRMS